MSRAWPAETREGVRAALQAGSTPAEIQKIYKVPQGTIRCWAAEWGLPAQNGRPTSTTRLKIPAVQIPSDLREELREAVRAAVSRLKDPRIPAKDFDNLARGLRTTLEMTPDLLTYEEKLEQPRGESRGVEPARVLSALGIDPERDGEEGGA